MAVIPFRFVSDREFCLSQALSQGDASAVAILEAGEIDTEEQARILARFYWRMVDATAADEVEAEMENLHNAFSAACHMAGLAEVWHAEIPED